MVFFDIGKKEKIKKIEDLPHAQFSRLSKSIINGVLEKDEEVIEDGKLISDAINYGVASFIPDLFFERLVKNYRLTKEIYGPSVIRKISGYNDRELERSIRFPEFRKELKEKIRENIEKLQEKKLLDREHFITEKGVELASLVLYTEELDKLMPMGIFGEKVHKKSSVYGDREDTRPYKRTDRYRDVSVRKSVKTAIRRKHRKIEERDLRTYERESKGQIHIIYALDASGSMKGKKIEMCKKAGIALAYKAIDEKDKVGLIVFGSDIRCEIPPSDDFTEIMKEITKIAAKKETNIRKTIERAIELFPEKKITRHLILLTDALPTIGENPERETLEAVSKARSSNTTISLIGINLNKKGEKLAKKMIEIGEGKLYLVRDLKEIDKIILEDYYSIS